MTDTHEEKMKIIQKRLAEEYQANKPKIQLLRNLSLYDPNYSDKYKNLSVRRVTKVNGNLSKSSRARVSIREIARPPRLNDDSAMAPKVATELESRRAEAEKIYPEHHYDPTLARERKQTFKPIFER